MRFIDTHCHPYLNKQKKISEIIKSFFKNGWEAMIVIWTNLNSISKSLELAKNYDNIYFTVWIHPCDVYSLNLEKSIITLEKAYFENSEKIVGIWESGLDYYWIERDLEKMNVSDVEKQKIKEEKKKKQRDFFVSQLNLAKKLNLPLVIHNREAKNDIFGILKQENFKNFVFHCYTEDLEFANRLLDFAPNCKISFSWIITFKNAIEVQETAKSIPIKNILAETDSPYLTPVPYRWTEENEPVFTKFVIEKIAELREENLEKVADDILKNSKEVFEIA